ncbi:metallophosphoesterase family protein [Marinobacter fonticola]|uniref:hypothetical protein n=1 Tax=Marinobacter fonticola TaxID=2603215 RepID=UPI0011E71E25|nr:hypothetical protein [Marinobacter fonticola]
MARCDRDIRSMLAGLALCLAVTGLTGHREARAAGGAYTLQLLHFSDVDGEPGVAIDNVERFSALVSAFRTNAVPTLLLSSGDNVKPGPLYDAGASPDLANTLGVPAKGRAGIALMNALGVDASVIGNHDLDGGPAEFAALLMPETGAQGTYPGARFPYVSANLDFSAEPALSDLAAVGGQAGDRVAGRIAPSVVMTVGGERIGIVGGTTPDLPEITRTGGIRLAAGLTTDTVARYPALASSIQTAVDVLVQHGINKIILLAHMQQLDIEQALAQRLSGVDVIVAGGSSALLADANDTLREGHEAAGDYPLVFESPQGEPVLVVNVDGDYEYLGRLVMTFDQEGVIQTGALDPQKNGAWATTEAVVDRLGAQPDPDIEALVSRIRDVLNANSPASSSN